MGGYSWRWAAHELRIAGVGTMNVNILDDHIGVSGTLLFADDVDRLINRLTAVRGILPAAEGKKEPSPSST